MGKKIPLGDTLSLNPYRLKIDKNTLDRYLIKFKDDSEGVPLIIPIIHDAYRYTYDHVYLNNMLKTFISGLNNFDTINVHLPPMILFKYPSNYKLIYLALDKDDMKTNKEIGDIDNIDKIKLDNIKTYNKKYNIKLNNVIINTDLKEDLLETKLALALFSYRNFKNYIRISNCNIINKKVSIEYMSDKYIIINILNQIYYTVETGSPLYTTLTNLLEKYKIKENLIDSAIDDELFKLFIEENEKKG